MLHLEIQRAPISDGDRLIFDRHAISPDDIALFWQRLPLFPGHLLSYIDPNLLKVVLIPFLWDFQKFCCLVQESKALGTLKYRKDETVPSETDDLLEVQCILSRRKQ